jgi:hypothetical protein
MYLNKKIHLFFLFAFSIFYMYSSYLYILFTNPPLFMYISGVTNILYGLIILYFGFKILRGDAVNEQNKFVSRKIITLSSLTVAIMSLLIVMYLLPYHKYVMFYIKIFGTNFTLAAMVMFLLRFLK